MSDSRNSAEQLDGDVLGEAIGDDGLPGVGDYPPDTARGVNDPNLVGRDDVAMREARLRDEASLADPARDAAGDLLPPDGDDGARDDVQQLLGSDAADTVDAAPTPAEAAAVHVTEDTNA
ncbi:MAG: hypothetical protein HKN41_06700 [Ilumatobacter sp.]|nr:hypothetical protein [Ilumatobacter sp.]